MSTLLETESTRSGVDVAYDLGWPKDRVGVRGAAGGLIELGASYERPRTSRVLVKRYRANAMRHLSEHLIAVIKRYPS